MADENQPITLTDTFPSDLVPQTSGLGGAGLDVRCQRPDGDLYLDPLRSRRATTESVQMPVMVNVARLSAPVSPPDTVTVSSNDANPSNATDTETYFGLPVRDCVLTFRSQPVDSQVNTAMLNADGTQTTMPGRGPSHPDRRDGPELLGPRDAGVPEQPEQRGVRRERVAQQHPDRTRSERRRGLLADHRQCGRVRLHPQRERRPV